MSSGKQDSERACVVCRRTRPQKELLAFGRVGALVCLERPGRGRGAYVCISRACLGNVGPKALGRAFKAAITIPEPLRGAALLPTVHSLAERRLLETLGLARRSGEVLRGVDRVGRETRESLDKGVVIAACDLSVRSGRQAERIGAQPFVDADRIGRALGTGRVGLLAIAKGRLGDRADYWLRLWTETYSERSTDPSTNTNEDHAVAVTG